MFLEKHQDSFIFVRPRCRARKTVIFRRIKHRFKILCFLQSNQLFDQLYRILRRNIVVN